MKNKQQKLNKVFEGEHAVFDFLNPEALNMTPIIELPDSLNNFKKDKVRIFIKLVNSSPLLNIKYFTAWQMLSGIPKDKRGSIKNLVEFSSGNTVFSLAILSKYFGIQNMHAIITPDVLEHKKKLLKLAGADILISDGPRCPDVSSQTGGVYQAKILGDKNGWYNLNQYTNKNSQIASETYIGKELWVQLGNKLSIFVSTIGTAGTIFGAGKYLKGKNKNLFICGATIKRGSSIPGPRGEEAINKLSFPWSFFVNKTIPVDQDSAYLESLKLIRTGLLVGPSTGMQLAMINKLIPILKKNKTLNKYKNKKGEILVTFLACDTMFPYVDDYFSILPKKYFKPERTLNI
ncbi:MAG: pyridoxal-phosphate dependent enzyme [Candidatus Paceibacterota bacterium]|jgi:cysteine synthase A